MRVSSFTDCAHPRSTPAPTCLPISWLRWYQTQGASGEEPPAPVREQMELYDDLKASNDQERRDELMKRILLISREYFYHIGTSLIAPTFAVVKNNLRNVPESMPSSFIFSTPVSVNPQQWYFSE